MRGQAEISVFWCDGNFKIPGVKCYLILIRLSISVFQCVDVDECAANLCAPGALCTNFAGAFHCECPPGTTGDAYRTGCVDVNECATNPCGLNAFCKNTLGSYQCVCPPGFVGDPYHQCSGKWVRAGIASEKLPWHSQMTMLRSRT